MLLLPAGGTTRRTSGDQRLTATGVMQLSVSAAAASGQTPRDGHHMLRKINTLQTLPRPSQGRRQDPALNDCPAAQPTKHRRHSAAKVILKPYTDGTNVFVYLSLPSGYVTLRYCGRIVVGCLANYAFAKDSQLVILKRT